MNTFKANVQQTMLIGIMLICSLHLYSQPPKNYTSLEEAISNPADVYRLSFRNQNLPQIPQQVFKSPNLCYRDLSNNQIETVSDQISTLTNLFYLDLSGNEISQLPIGLSKVKALRNLYLYYTHPVSLESDFNFLKELAMFRYIDLTDNKMLNILLDRNKENLEPTIGIKF